MLYACLYILICKHYVLYACIYAHMYVHIHTFMSIHTCTHACTHTHTNTHTWYAARLNCMENAVYKLLDHACLPTLVSLLTYARTHTRTHAHAHTLVRATWALAQGTTGRQGWIRFDMHLWLLAADCAAGKCRHGAGAGGAARPLPRQVCSSSHQ